MEAPRTDWNKEAVLAAASEAARLSDLLKTEGFYKSGALQWLLSDHCEKFLASIDADEAKELRCFGARWFYSDDRIATSGLTILQDLLTLHNGQDMLAQLATLEPVWIARWWKWKGSKRGPLYGDDLIPGVLIIALSLEEFQSHESEFSDEQVAGIITLRPDLLDVVAIERLGNVLSLAVEDSGDVSDLTEALSRHGLPSDAATMIDAILDRSSGMSDDLSRLDELVAAWEGPPVSNPVTRAIGDGHQRLEATLRSPWKNCGEPSEGAFWKDGIPWKAPKALAAAVSAFPSRFRLELGFSVGVRIAESASEPSIEIVRKTIETLGIDPSTALVDTISQMAGLWATLRKLVEFEHGHWKHETELVGLRARAIATAQAHPDLWAEALPWILARAAAIGPVAQSVTIELTTASEEVRLCLERACDHELEAVRLLARGLRTLIEGFDDPNSGLARSLADAAAHFMDGTPIFPHPLAVASATWLGSKSLESAIATGVKRASERFAAQVRDQGGIIEEVMVEAITKELEFEFRDLEFKLKSLMGNDPNVGNAVLSVRQRPSSKSIEEPIYGCDLALLLNGAVRGRYKATWADLVQVKKSSALHHHRIPRFRADSWKIAKNQLYKILEWSMTATYWMIASAGEVLVIPARHLLAIERGRERHMDAKSFTVGYHEVRTTGIPLEHYLVDLLIGQWVGTSSEEVLRFALGENANIRPRAVIEVTIAIGPHG